MRPLRLDMEGFGTFAQPCGIDFGDVDFFALIGPTGAGKSTVLDAMCFALYGRVPRWGTGIEYALAPSASSGKVRLVFTAANQIYVTTRVVKRGAKGKVTTSSAALERLASEVSVTDLDDVNNLIGVALAGSAKAVTEQVERVIGLPFDQFTKCVLLPQGAFAEFLHSSAADRRKILENLLGYAIYRDIQTAAGSEQRSAEAVLDHIDHQLQALPEVTDAVLAKSEQRLAQLRTLVHDIGQHAPKLDELTQDASQAAQSLHVLDEEQSQLTYIRIPADVDSISSIVSQSNAAVNAERTAVTAAEQDEDRLRTQSDNVDLVQISKLITAYSKYDEVSAEIKTGTAWIEKATGNISDANQEIEHHNKAVSDAEVAVETAIAANLADTLKEGLTSGDDCPVCQQPVHEVPTSHPTRTKVSAARDALAAAKQRRQTAQNSAEKLQQELAGFHARLSAKHDEHTVLLAELKDAPQLRELHNAAQVAQDAKQQLTTAGTTLRKAREKLRSAESALTHAHSQQNREWEKFDHHRDRVARLGPPAADRSDLATAWHELATWAASELDTRKHRRNDYAKRVGTLDSKLRSVRNELSVWLSQAEVAMPRGDDCSGADFVEAAAAAQRQAAHDHQQLNQQRERYVQLCDERAACLHKLQVAKQLHQHLGTRQFVNWLLTEALDELVIGASRILHQLTAGQYDLVYLDNDFYVVDHHDADLTRPVKTLSGGETFTASLALALAMSDQLAGMSSQGACLESILLDEGFGTLDAGTLDQVAASLESLSGTGKRMVGVVTHVPALAERIPVRFAVSKDAHGSHVTRTNDDSLQI